MGLKVAYLHFMLFCAYESGFCAFLCFFLRVKVAYLRFVVFCACGSFFLKNKQLEITLISSIYTTTNVGMESLFTPTYFYL